MPDGPPRRFQIKFTRFGLLGPVVREVPPTGPDPSWPVGDVLGPSPVIEVWAGESATGPAGATGDGPATEPATGPGGGPAGGDAGYGPPAPRPDPTGAAPGRSAGWAGFRGRPTDGWSGRSGRLSSPLGDAAAAIASEVAGRALGQLSGGVAGWRDPARRLRRRRRWARRSLTFWLFATSFLGLLTVLVIRTGSSAGGAELFFIVATAVAGAEAALAGRKLRKLRRVPEPLSAAGVLPPRGSAARPAMERLAERERVLAGLAVHLGPSAASTCAAATDAAGALYAHAARVTAIDQARRGARGPARHELDKALTGLLRQLDEGVARYDELVLAAAAAVSASASFQAGDQVLAARLVDATDALAGLAAGLRHVTPGG
ncbi:MAG TPA: hypothetical protein VMU51_09560 [Mycobacteriales bacterium]|nr:hypothetical protein [Mycobacteriales bacterium]